MQLPLIIIWLEKFAATFFLVAMFSSLAISHDVPHWEQVANEDRLNTQEEELVYAAKNPAARVTVCLRIAERKIETAKRLQRSNSKAILAETLKGYLAAVQGANLGVSWGTSLGEDMRRQSATIAKTVKKHAAVLERLGSLATAEERPALLKMHDILLTQ